MCGSRGGSPATNCRQLTRTAVRIFRQKLVLLLLFFSPSLNFLSSFPLLFLPPWGTSLRPCSHSLSCGGKHLASRKGPTSRQRTTQALVCANPALPYSKPERDFSGLEGLSHVAVPLHDGGVGLPRAPARGALEPALAHQRPRDALRSNMSRSKMSRYCIKTGG